MMVINNCTDPWPLWMAGGYRQDTHTHTHTHTHHNLLPPLSETLQPFLLVSFWSNKTDPAGGWLFEQRKRFAATSSTGSLLLYLHPPQGGTVKQQTETAIRWGSISGLLFCIVCGALLSAQERRRRREAQEKLRSVSSTLLSIYRRHHNLSRPARSQDGSCLIDRSFEQMGASMPTIDPTTAKKQSCRQETHSLQAPGDW